MGYYTPDMMLMLNDTQRGQQEASPRGDVSCYITLRLRIRALLGVTSGSERKSTSPDVDGTAITCVWKGAV